MSTLKTFNMKIVRDKGIPWQDDIKKITEDMRSRGMYPQGWEKDENNFYIGGNYACTCKDKFDKAYCDEEGC